MDAVGDSRDSTYPDVEVPDWNESTGELFWRGQLVLLLAAQADCERAVLAQFQQRNWAPTVPSPFVRPDSDDLPKHRRAAQRRRDAKRRWDAVYNLNQHQTRCESGFSAPAEP